MQREKILETIGHFIIAETNLDDTNFLQHETDLFEAGLLDSLLIVSLVAFCESEFDCNIDDENMTEDNFRSIAALADLICRTTGNEQSLQN